MMVFRGCRDVRYIRSEISKALCVPPEDVELRDQLNRVLHNFGDDMQGRLLLLPGGAGNNESNPITVNLDMHSGGSIAKVAFEAGLFGNRPALTGSDMIARIGDPNATQLERLLMAVRYLRDTWARLPAFVMRRNEGKRIIAIGDIHANARLLPQIDGIIRDNPNAIIIFTGDYVDRGAPSGPESDPEVIIQMALWQYEFGDRIIFLRGNHETRVVNQQYGLEKQLKRFGYGMGNVVWEALNKAFDELPIAAYAENCFACHGGVPGGKIGTPYDGIPDLSTLDKTRAEVVESHEISFLWSDIEFTSVHSDGYFDGTRGIGYLIYPKTEIGILEKLRYEGTPLMPRVLIKGHDHVSGSKRCDGSYSNGNPVTLTCVIGSYQKIEKGFGYAIVETDGTVNHVRWDVR
jgi:predicted phosphodiesterase